MRIETQWSNSLGGEQIPHLAIGFFDGIHRGHREVIGAHPTFPAPETCVVTFNPHPIQVLRPAQAPCLITGLPHKLKLLQNLNLHSVFICPFNRETANWSAEYFLERLHASFPKVRAISVGPNWRFGRNRSGNLDFLAQWTAARGIELRIARQITLQGQLISSSSIRTAIAEGALNHAAQALGRPISWLGTIAHGRGVGRTLGFPTINLQTEDTCRPPPGVYAGKVHLDDHRSFPAAIHVGPSPTFESGNLSTIEAHLIDQNLDLYGATVEIELSNFIRGPRRFANPEELSRQLRADCQRVLTLAEESGAGTI